MFSTSQMDFIENTVMQMYLQGYEYYVVHTNTRVNSETSYGWRDLTLYFFKDEISAVNQYRFQVGNGVKMDVITSNANDRYRDERIIKSNINSQTINIDDYEFIMTNAKESQMMNVLANTEYINMRDVGFNLSNFEILALPVILCVCFVYKWLHKVFPRLERDKKV